MILQFALRCDGPLYKRKEAYFFDDCLCCFCRRDIAFLVKDGYARICCCGSDRGRCILATAVALADSLHSAMRRSGGLTVATYYEDKLASNHEHSLYPLDECVSFIFRIPRRRQWSHIVQKL